MDTLDIFCFKLKGAIFWDKNLRVPSVISKRIMAFICDNMEYTCYSHSLGFPGGSMIKNPPADAGDVDLIPVSGRSSGEGNGNPLHYSCLEKPMDRGNWQATVRGLQRIGHD